VLAYEHIEWADKILVMEHKQKKRLRQKIGRRAAGLKLNSLDIPDDFGANDPVLVDLLVRKLSFHFGSAQ